MATYEIVNIPCVYILMTSKSEVLYNSAFNHIKNLCQVHNYEVKTDFMMLDFEKGSKAAMRAVFPQVKVRGCYFHFCQCL